MKLTSIFLLACCLQISAKSSSQSVTLKVRNAPLSKVFNEIKKQTGYTFVYTATMLKKANPVTVEVSDVTLQDALAACFTGQPLFYRIIDKTVVVHSKASSMVSQGIGVMTTDHLLPIMSLFRPSDIGTLVSPKELTLPQVEIQGRVTDKEGNPLAGASITVKGSRVGTSTDANGAFTINVPDANSVLIVSFTGYVSQEIQVDSRIVIDIQLMRGDNALSEVVVTALGISREKKSLSYAVSEVNGSSLSKAPEVNFGAALSGKIAGVDASNTANGPGGSSRVIIRGNGSLSGDNQPLYIVNGVPITNATLSSPGTYGGVDRGDGLNSINPDDIESISVLKGGTAAALYGSRAASGVILITTKSGKIHRGIGVEYNSVYTMAKPLTAPKWQYEYGSGSRGAKPTSQLEAIANGRMSWGAKLDGSLVPNPDGVARPYSAQKHNIRNFYNNGQTFINTLALSAGNNDARFRFSVSDMEDHGIVPNSSVNRKIFNLSANANLAKKVVFEGNAQFNIEENKNRTYVSDFTKNPNAAVGLIGTSIDVRTLAPGYDENGYETPWSDYVFVVNPYFAVNKVKNRDDRKRFIGSFSITYNITDFLYARARVGIDYYNINWQDITPTGILYSPQGSMSTSRSVSLESNVEGILGFHKNFNKLSANVIVGGNKMYSQIKSGGLNSGLFIVPFDYFISNGSSQTFTDGFQESAINSLFASADVGFDDFIYLTLTGRQDWFSTLSFDNNSLFYPSVGLSYLFSQTWSSKPVWLSFGKLRASWAQVGGGAPTPYGIGLRYTGQSVMHLGQQLMNITGNNIPNALKPYTSTTKEAGVELRLWKDKVGVDVTVYDRTTTNDIVNASVSLASSYRSVSLNVGEIRNRGVELALTGSPLNASGRLNWNVSYNFAYNNNTVVKLAEGLSSLSIPGASPRTNNAFIYHYEGMPFGMIAGFKMKTDDNGNIVYNNANGLPLQSAIMPLGKGVPPVTMGLTNDFAYRNFSFGFLLDGKFGGSLYTSTNAYGTYFGTSKKTVENNVRETGVQVDGVDQNGAAYHAVIPAQTYYQGIAYSITDQFVYHANFIKLREVSFGYALSTKLLSKTPFQAATLSLIARNLLLIYSQVPNVDPESNYNNSNAQGLEMFGVPTARNYGVNLLIRF